MKKFILVTFLVCAFSSVSFGAASEDIYLRRDVFDAKMDAFMAEMRLGFQSLREELHNEIQGVEKRLNTKIEDIKVDIAKIDGRIDGIDRQTNMLVTVVYWIIAFIGIMFTMAALPVFSTIWQFITKKSSKDFTLEDVERLIELKLNAKPQI